MAFRFVLPQIPLLDFVAFFTSVADRFLHGSFSSVNSGENHAFVYCSGVMSDLGLFTALVQGPASNTVM